MGPRPLRPRNFDAPFTILRKNNLQWDRSSPERRGTEKCCNSNDADSIPVSVKAMIIH